MGRNIAMVAPADRGPAVVANRLVQLATPVLDIKDAFDSYTHISHDFLNSAEVMFTEGDLVENRELVQDALLSTIALGVDDPEGFCPHACDGHGLAVVSEICELITQGANTGNIRIKVESRKGVPEYRWGVVVSPERALNLNSNDSIVSLPVILAAVIRYDPEPKTMEAILQSVNPDFLCTAFALAQVPYDSLFVRNDKSIFSSPFNMFKGLTPGLYVQMYNTAFELSEQELDINSIAKQLLLLQGYKNSDLKKIPITGGWVVSLSPRVIFNSVYNTLGSHIDDQLVGLYRSRNGGKRFTTGVVTAYTSLYASKPNHPRKGLSGLLSDLGVRM